MSASKASTSSAARTKSADLERIRNNQRRCRARRKEYIAELEDKIRKHESASDPSSANPELQRLARENELLKGLLKSLGLGDDFLKAYSKAIETVPEVLRAQLGDEGAYQSKGSSSYFPFLDGVQSDSIPTMTRELQAQNPSLLSSTNTEAPTQRYPQFFESSSLMDAVVPWEPFDFPTVSTFALGSLQTEIQPQSPVQLTRDSLMTEELSTMTTAGDISDRTTLCSLAFSLVLKNNLKGYSLADLDPKLSVGYRHGNTPSEGCRVDNKILFNVLAEIS